MRFLTLTTGMFLVIEQAFGGANLYSTYGMMTKNQQASVDNLLNACTDPSKTRLLALDSNLTPIADPLKASFAQVVIDLQGTDSQTPSVFNCSGVGVGPIYLPSNPAVTAKLEKKSCDSNRFEYEYRQISKLAEATKHASQMKECEAIGTKILSGSCAKEIGCNVARSLVDPIGIGKFLAENIKKIEPPKKQGCTDMGQANCLSSIFEEVVKVLLSPVDLIKGVGAAAVSAAKGMGHFVSSWFTGGAEKTSTSKMVAAANANNSTIADFMHDPGKFLSGAMQKIMSWIVNKGDQLMNSSINAGNSAAKWWKCATCNDLLNSTCQIAGVLGGPIILSFFTGGAAALLMGPSQASEVGGILKRLGTKVMEADAALAKSSSLYRTVTQAGRTILQIPKKFSEFLNGLPLMRNYVAANDRAFMRGYLGKEGFSRYVYGEKYLASIKSVKTVLGSEPTVEESTVIHEHPEIPWATIKDPNEVKILLQGLKEQEIAHETELSELVTLAKSNPALASQKAQEYISGLKSQEEAFLADLKIHHPDLNAAHLKQIEVGIHMRIRDVENSLKLLDDGTSVNRVIGSATETNVFHGAEGLAKSARQVRRSLEKSKENAEKVSEKNSDVSDDEQNLKAFYELYEKVILKETPQLKDNSV